MIFGCWRVGPNIHRQVLAREGRMRPTLLA
jgi:hypothetical protein